MTEQTIVSAANNSRSGAARWLDTVQVALQRLGFVTGARHVLVVPRQRSGIADSTLVTVHSVEGERYVIADTGAGHWVQDARVAGRGLLCRGRMEEHVCLSELPLPERIALFQKPEMAATVAGWHGGASPAGETLPLASRVTVFRLKRC